jgi:hypothetical protein
LNAIAHVLDVAEIEAFVVRKKTNEYAAAESSIHGANTKGFEVTRKPSPSRIPVSATDNRVERFSSTFRGAVNRMFN